jgi:hypothetical protein
MVKNIEIKFTINFIVNFILILVTLCSPSVVMFWSNLFLKGCVLATPFGKRCFLVQPFPKRLLKGCCYKYND